MTTSTRMFPAEALLITDDAALANQLGRILERMHHRRVVVASSFSAAQELLARRHPEAVFVDFRAHLDVDDPSGLLRQLGRGSGVPVIAVSDAGYLCNWATIADLIVDGYIQLPLDRAQLAHLFDCELAKKKFDTATGSVTPRVLKGETITFRTYTPELFRLLGDLQTIAEYDVTVLLAGETGTGKTTLARLIHELSPRRTASFLNVACGALPPELIESELFGHTKGAFTSAECARVGKFAAAKGGSLLLDEIDVLDLARQAKLLRVIETGEFEPVGSNETLRSRARLIVASNIDLTHLMEKNMFRADLYYRLNMMEYRIPPLRERRRDIVPLALDFIEGFCSDHGVKVRRVHPDFLSCLKTYRWPGNVRELKNHIRRAVLFCRTGILTPDDLASQIRRVAEAPSSGAASEQEVVELDGGTLFERDASSEREILERALQDNDQNRTATAQALGLSRVGLYKKLKKYGMITPRRSAAEAGSAAEAH